MKRRSFLQLLGLGAVAASAGPCRSIVEAKPAPVVPDPTPRHGPEMIDWIQNPDTIIATVERDLAEALARQEDRAFMASAELDEQITREIRGTSLIRVKPNSVSYPVGRGERVV